MQKVRYNTEHCEQMIKLCKYNKNVANAIYQQLCKASEMFRTELLPKSTYLFIESTPWNDCPDLRFVYSELMQHIVSAVALANELDTAFIRGIEFYESEIYGAKMDNLVKQFNERK